MTDFEISPIQFTLDILSRKWTIPILESLRSGRKRFTDLLEISEQLSSKVLSERLKDLFEFGIIDKIIVNIMPIQAKYQLSRKGNSLLPILFELALFSSVYFSEQFYFSRGKNSNEIIDNLGTNFEIDKESLNIIKKRRLNLN
jgi:DNA-binding HxlR family transcriptional regulator